MHSKHTLDALLPWVYSARFTQQIVTHRLTQLEIQALAQRSKPVRPRERERKRKEGEGQFELEFGQSSNVFSRVLTWFDQKHPAGTGPRSHKGRPLMPLPLLPCWPNPLPPTSLRQTWCCDAKLLHKKQNSLFYRFVFAGCDSMGT